MGKSFFTGTDDEVFTGSRAFAEKIVADAAAYGLTEAQAAAYAAVDSIWQAAYLAAKAAQTRTAARIIGMREAKRAVRVMASDLARIIQGQPDVSDAQKIDLGLSVRATPAPLPPPGEPTSFTVALDGNGTLILKWKCQNPPGSRGTFYQLWRSVGPAGERVYLGMTGKKRSVDRTLPAGASNVAYHVQAARSTKSGPWGRFDVSFGVSGSALPEMQLAKMAA